MSPQVTYPLVLQYTPAPDRSPIRSSQSMSQQPVSSHSSYSDPIHIPKQQNTARMPSTKPTIIAPNHTMSLQNTYDAPVLHIPDPNLVDNSSTVKILSDQVIVSPVRDYLENFNYNKELCFWFV